MHLSDKAIESTKDDGLERLAFSKHLADTIISWKNEECLVISLCGKWGSGKTSILNFVKEYVNEANKEKFDEMPFFGVNVKIKKEGEPKYREILFCGVNTEIEETDELDEEITIIEFNPWQYSGEQNLAYHFYNELAKEIRIRGGTDSDKEISKKLMLYSSVLDVFSYGSSKFLKNFSLVFGVGLFLILSSTKNMSFLYLIAIFSIILGLSKDLFDKVARVFEEKAKFKEKPLSALKYDLKNQLLERKKKILIIIDDIDRLNKCEIKQIFQLVKVNTDFPNIIYLMAFDKEIIEKNLEDGEHISGRDYLKKISQVDFDVPVVKNIKIKQFLFKELNSILSKLPVDSTNSLERHYWLEVSSSGFLDCFENLRDVKRFANSLEFNLLLMHKKTSLEVNIIDFISIEFIRIWYPGLYYSIKINKELLTTVPERYNDADFEKAKEAVENLLSTVDKADQQKIKKLLSVIFPQYNMICSKTNYTTDGKEWSRKLRICSKNHFDSYFVMIPGGGGDELPQYEVDSLFYYLENKEQLENHLQKYVNLGKINKMLWRLRDYTVDYSKIPRNSVINLIVVLFNLYGNIPSEKRKSKDILFPEEFSFELNNENIIMHIIIQLIDLEKEENERYNILLESIRNSVNVVGIVYYLSTQDYDGSKQIFSREHLEKLKEQCVEKIKKDINEENLLSIYNPLNVMICWKTWSKDSKPLKHLISEIIKSNDKLISFVKLFVNYRYRSDVVYINKHTPFYEILSDLIEIGTIYSRFESIKKDKREEYKSEKELIDIFLDYYSPK